MGKGYWVWVKGFSFSFSPSPFPLNRKVLWRHPGDVQLDFPLIIPMNIDETKKSGNSNNVSKFDQTFSRLSKCTAYGIGLLAAFTLTVQQNPQGVHLILLAKLFVQAAQIGILEQKKNGKHDNPDNSNKK
ncbi:hypothetical protein LC613_42745 [Nostoc sphaeroides CHAB 2801]|uniref:hypothetical protein n=1 Tax=Nostoc sphaeroides TaxID=446679 RepID=UPI001E5D07C6|nr:hypothetical protein [Nostoc sphaeroides]MCC5634122.1 hypothetical protein [Nostoc sphaeroides CHAB 2801]